ncbi:uncharacterized protein LOC118756524 [Rhagoletis pomonella]|uniref:uncharacterized protein LOC118756524 n=1 Tax=Rhagoletis pomonella TaxID=28610 RepID=UPI0017876166|nr:uncharacterized protein LOC118756524 [Rhagoletis pomonella]
MAKPAASEVRHSGTNVAMGSSHPQKHISASERYYRTRRSALRILERLRDKKPEELTAEELDSRNWAEKFMAEHQAKAKQESAQGKRKSSRELSSEPKRTRVSAFLTADELQKRSFADAAKDTFTRAVIDRSSLDGAISPQNWDLVNRRLWAVYKEVLGENPGPPPSCADAGWFQNRVKLTRCADQRSVDLYTLAISRVGEVWQGARLEAIKREDIPNRPRSRAWIPDFHTDPQEVLEWIRMGNPELPTHDWKVAKIGDVDGKRRLAVIVLNEESVEPLANQNWRINYGFQALNLRVYRQDVSGKQHPTDEASAVESATDDEVASTSGMVGELFERVTLEEGAGDHSDFSDTMVEGKGEDILPLSDEEDVNRTVVGCPAAARETDGGDSSD